MRSPQEIDKDYTNLCTLAGDRMVKKEALQKEIDALLAKVNELADEKNQVIAALQKEQEEKLAKEQADKELAETIAKNVVSKRKKK